MVPGNKVFPNNLTGRKCTKTYFTRGCRFHKKGAVVGGGRAKNGKR